MKDKTLEIVYVVTMRDHSAKDNPFLMTFLGSYVSLLEILDILEKREGPQLSDIGYRVVHDEMIKDIDQSGCYYTDFYRNRTYKIEAFIKGDPEV